MKNFLKNLLMFSLKLFDEFICAPCRVWKSDKTQFSPFLQYSFKSLQYLQPKDIILLFSDLLLQIICNTSGPSVTRKVDKSKICVGMRGLWQRDIWRGRWFATIFRCVLGVYKPVADVAEEKQKRGCCYTSSFFIVWNPLLVDGFVNHFDFL